MATLQLHWGRHEVNGKWQDKPIKDVYDAARKHYGHDNFYMGKNDLMTGIITFNERS